SSSSHPTSTTQIYTLSLHDALPISNNQIISNGTLEGTNTKNLAIYQADASSTLTISAVIANNTGATGLSKAGPGTLILSGANSRSEEHTSELQSRGHLVCRLLLEKK